MLVWENYWIVTRSHLRNSDWKVKYLYTVGPCYPKKAVSFNVWRWILLWPEEIDISVIVHCRRLLHRMCIAEDNLALDTPQNKSWSRLLFRAYDKQTNNVEANSGLDWPQTLVRGCQFTFIYTTMSFIFLPPQITEEQTSRLDNINSRQISKSSCNV